MGTSCSLCLTVAFGVQVGFGVGRVRRVLTKNLTHSGDRTGGLTVRPPRSTQREEERGLVIYNLYRRSKEFLGSGPTSMSKQESNVARGLLGGSSGLLCLAGNIEFVSDTTEGGDAFKEVITGVAPVAESLEMTRVLSSTVRPNRSALIAPDAID